jgi:branched-chain amino acid transport system permease protein
MPSAALISAVMYASILILLSIGFTFTHMIEKFPNFAHTSFATFGVVISYTFVRLWGYGPYTAWPFAFVLSGLFGIALYLLVVRPMRRVGTSGVHITFAMIALSYVINATLAVYSYWVMRTRPFTTASFMLRRFDFTIMGYPGIVFMAPVTSVILVVLLHLFLTRTRFGIAIRATVEDPSLASGLGVNTFHVHLTSWFLTGAMAGLAGAALPLWMPTSLNGSDELMMSVIAGSVLGGLDSIYGAIIGGIVLSYAKTLLPIHLVRTLGIWIAWYIPLVPILVVVGVMMLMPEGIGGALTANPGDTKSPRERIRRLLGLVK